MSIKRTIAYGTALPLFTLFAGCLAASDQAVDEEPSVDTPESTPARKAPLSYEEYREEALQTIDGRELFIVEGDMIFDTEEALKAHYDGLHVRPRENGEKSVIRLVNGVREVRPRATNIKYCFSNNWGVETPYKTPPLSTVKANIQNAMKSWESVADIKFVHISNLDGAGCNTSVTNLGVDFVITNWNDTRSSGPFPSNIWPNQRLLVGKITPERPASLTYALALHELGHVLGFMHENNNAGADPSCPEGAAHENLTSFDADSVMLYSECATNSINGTPLSALDAKGARRVYGPTRTNSLYAVQSNRIWRADNDDGTTKQMRADDWSEATSIATLGSFFYVIQKGYLWRVDPATDAVARLGDQAWTGPTTMAGINGTLYITQSHGLYKITNLSTGAWARVGTGDWTDATSMAALGGSLYIIQNSSLLKVNPTNGTWTRLGQSGSWAGPTSMATVGNSLYIVQNGSLLLITNLNTGTWARVGNRNDWVGTTSMTSLDGMLYMMQDGRLWRTSPINGGYTSLGSGWGGPTLLTSIPL